MNIEHHNYSICLLQDFKTLEDSGNRMYEDNDEQDFYNHIVMSGIQKTMVETLRVPLCRYVSEVIDLPSSEAKSTDMQVKDLNFFFLLIFIFYSFLIFLEYSKLMQGTCGITFNVILDRLPLLNRVMWKVTMESLVKKYEVKYLPTFSGLA